MLHTSITASHDAHNMNFKLLGVYNLVLKHIIILSLFLSISKKKNSFEVLAKICIEWPPQGSMKIKLNLLGNSSICCVTCLALSWVSLKVFKYHKFQLNLWWHENCILNVIDPKNICLWNEWVKGNTVKLNHYLLDVNAQSMESFVSKGSSCSTS